MKCLSTSYRLENPMDNAPTNALAAVAISYGTIAILARKRGSTAVTIAVHFAVSILLVEQLSSSPRHSRWRWSSRRQSDTARL
jgi:hypothetical protein